METLEYTVVEKDWQIDRSSKGNTIFTADEVISAYFSGKKDGQEMGLKLLLKQIGENLQSITNATKGLVNYLKEGKIKPISIKMRIESVSNFTILTLLNEEDFIADSFLKIYDFTEELEGKMNNEFLQASFQFSGISDSNALNVNALLSDGFQLTLKHD